MQASNVEQRVAPTLTPRLGDDVSSSSTSSSTGVRPPETFWAPCTPSLLCGSCGETVHLREAQFCYQCGAPLMSDAISPEGNE